MNDPNVPDQPSQPTSMEVHHHGGHDHGPKTWKSYASEFFMLFFAVFCGSMAEYYLEHKIEADREKEYVKAVITDLKKDTLALNEVAMAGPKQTTFYSNICIAVSMFSRQKIDADSLLKMYATKSDVPVTIYVNNAAFTQLKSSGGLRLIKRDSSRNAMSEYYTNAERLDDLRKLSSTYMIEVARTNSKVIDWGVGRSPDLMTVNNPSTNFNKAAYVKKLTELMVYNRDPQTLHELGNSYFILSNLQRSYLEGSQEQKKLAKKLLNTLKDEYGFE
jgi:hypothetical protein